MGDEQDDPYAARRAELEQRFHSLPAADTLEYWQLIEQTTQETALPLEVLARCLREREKAGVREQAARVYGAIMGRIQRRVQARVSATVRACPSAERKDLEQELEHECQMQAWKELIDLEDKDTWFFEHFTHRLDRVMGHVAHSFMEQRGFWKRRDVGTPTRVPARQQDSLDVPIAPGESLTRGQTVADLTAQDALARVELISDIEALLTILTPEERALLYDLYWSGLTQQEVADRLGVTDRTVRNRLERILARLREVYQGGEEG